MADLEGAEEAPHRLGQSSLALSRPPRCGAFRARDRPAATYAREGRFRRANAMHYPERGPLFAEYFTYLPPQPAAISTIPRIAGP